MAGYYGDFGIFGLSGSGLGPASGCWFGINEKKL